MNFTPEMNDGKHVFVFGSNLLGVHGLGAALEARKHWGAEMWVGMGETGNAYAIATKDTNMRRLSLPNIKSQVDAFLLWAKDNPDTTFLVTAIGTGLAGYSHYDIAPMFKDAPPNCVLPDQWKMIISGE